jgi:hypothetical protein
VSLTKEHIDALLKPISPARVGKDGKGFSHVEAWDIRRTMNQIFGFAEWSAEVIAMEMIYEDSKEVQGKARWSVAYRAQCRVTVNGASYIEWASGDATNYPSRADAHDQAMKTAESQAFKRACVNLGDQFGLSLYKDGSTAPTVVEVIGQVHADMDRVPGWLSAFTTAKDMIDVASCIAEIKQSDISAADRDILLKAYKTAEKRINGGG